MGKQDIRSRCFFRTILCLAFLLSVIGLDVSGQSRQADMTVTGTVLDVEAKPVVGATVMVKGNASLGGTITDNFGKYSITVPRGSTLRVTCIGYLDAEKAFSNSGKWNVTLEESSEILDDVVVVGYGTQKKESVVGSISQVGTEELVNSGTTNITSAIAGKLAGVLTFQSSGQPGSSSDAQIFVRGLSSWNGSAPLVMVDGVERSFKELDPNEVKTISVLKDASATAVFGAKGANGVILVTTKTGAKGPAKMNLKVEYGMENPTHLPKFIDSATTLEMLDVAYKNEQNFGALYGHDLIEKYRSGENPYRYPNNNWYGMFLKKLAHNFNANYSVSGGTDVVKYYVSVGYSTEGSTFNQINDSKYTRFKYNKINYRSNLDFNVTKSTTLSFRLGGSTEITQHPGSSGGIFTNMFAASPCMFPAYFPADALEKIPDLDYPGAYEDRLSQKLGSYAENPYTLIASGSFNQTTRNKLNTDVELVQKLDFITKGLSLKGIAAFTSVFSRTSMKATKTYPTYKIDWDTYDLGSGNPWVSSVQSNDVYVETPYPIVQDNNLSSSSVIFYWEASVNYARKFGKHNVTGLALMNQRQYISGSSFPNRSEAYVTRFTYDYAGKYLFEVNMGYTGSEQFAPSNRFGFFPSAAVGYVVSKERFWDGIRPWWNKLKIRYSDGLVGSDSASNNWLYFSSFVRSSGNIVEEKAANATAKWETAHKRDIGIDFGWMKDAITLSVDFFDEKRKDMLVTPVDMPFSGVSSKDLNLGKMKKHGVDIEAKYRKDTQSGFHYEVGFNLGLNENRIEKYADPVATPDYQKLTGKPYKSAATGMNMIDSGYFTSIDDLHGYPNSMGSVSSVYPGVYKLLDYDLNGSITTTDLHAIAGNAYPPAVGSISLGFGYKGFYCSLMLYGTMGKYIDYNRGYWKEFIKQDLTVHTAQLDYWTPTNRDASHPALSYDDKAYSMLGGSANTTFTMALEGQSWRKSDYYQLKEAYISYTFDSKKVKKALGVGGLTLTLTGNNLLTLTELLEGDPQRTALTNGYYPIMRVVKLGVKMNF